MAPLAMLGATTPLLATALRQRWPSAIPLGFVLLPPLFGDPGLIAAQDHRMLARVRNGGRVSDDGPDAP